MEWLGICAGLLKMRARDVYSKTFVHSYNVCKLKVDEG
jgi:hypothetical protein